MRIRDAGVQQRAQIVNTINSLILVVFGIFFLGFGVKAGLQDKESWILVALGALFSVFGVVRTWMILRLMREVSEISPEEQSLFEEEVEKDK